MPRKKERPGAASLRETQVLYKCMSACFPLLKHMASVVSNLSFGRRACNVRQGVGPMHLSGWSGRPRRVKRAGRGSPTWHIRKN